jgi:low temperature requirement protein LtrA
MHDVRFYADGIFERIMRAIHLGVMVGFAEIGTQFDPDKQIKTVFQSMSLFLFFSRLVLAIQYIQVLVQARHYNRGKFPILITIMLHLAAAAIYLGVSFRFKDNYNSRVFVVWYVGGLIEMIVHLQVSRFCESLSFDETHLGERFNLLTLIILGEGAILLAKNVSLVVKDTYIKDPTLATWSKLNQSRSLAVRS